MLGLVDAGAGRGGLRGADAEGVPVLRRATTRPTSTCIRDWLAANAPNVYPVGRNGMHKYNNQDHSMYTAMLTVENILGANHDVWAVNVEEDYHEEESGPVRREPRSSSTAPNTPVTSRTPGPLRAGRGAQRRASATCHRIRAEPPRPAFRQRLPDGPAVIIDLGVARLPSATPHGLCGGMVFAALDYWKHGHRRLRDDTPPGGDAALRYLVRRLVDSWDCRPVPLTYLTLMHPLLPTATDLSGRSRCRGRAWRMAPGSGRRCRLDRGGRPCPLGLVKLKSASRSPSAQPSGPGVRLRPDRDGFTSGCTTPTSRAPTT